MRRAVRAAALAVLPYILIALAFVAWITLTPAQQTVTVSAFEVPSQVRIVRKGAVVREISGTRDLQRVVDFMNSRRAAWQINQDRTLTGEVRLEFLGPGASRSVLEIDGHLWSLQSGGKVFTRLFSSDDLLALTDALGFPRPPEDKVRAARETAFDKFIRAVTTTAATP